MTQTRPVPNTQARRTLAIESDGDTQLIRLPADIHFDGDTVLLHRDEQTGDVILSQSPPRQAKTWDEMFEMFDAADIPDDFMAERPMNRPIDPRGVFDDELP